MGGAVKNILQGLASALFAAAVLFAWLVVLS